LVGEIITGGGGVRVAWADGGWYTTGMFRVQPHRSVDVLVDTADMPLARATT